MAVARAEVGARDPQALLPIPHSIRQTARVAYQPRRWPGSDAPRLPVRVLSKFPTDAIPPSPRQALVQARRQAPLVASNPIQDRVPDCRRDESIAACFLPPLG